MIAMMEHLSDQERQRGIDLSLIFVGYLDACFKVKEQGSFSADFDFAEACGVELLDGEVEVHEFMEDIRLVHVWAFLDEIIKGGCGSLQENRLKSLAHNSLVEQLFCLNH